jgi:hypothetical protein
MEEEPFEEVHSLYTLIKKGYSNIDGITGATALIARFP